MEEKTLIQSGQSPSAKAIWLSALKFVLYVFPALLIILVAVTNIEYYQQSSLDQLLFTKWELFIKSNLLLLIPAFLLLVILFTIIIWIISRNRLIVTDKRIIGVAAFGQQLDLPVDSIIAVKSVKLFRYLSISTAAGRVAFWAIPNQKEIHQLISNLLIIRQSNSPVAQYYDHIETD